PPSTTLFRSPPALVVHDRLRSGVVEGRVADLVAEQVRVEVLEHADLAFASELVLDCDLFEVDVAVEVHRIAATKAQPERLVVRRRIADECLVLVLDMAFPVVAADPAELAVDPDAEPARRADGVVLLSDVRVIDVAELVARVERDEEVAVAERDAAGQIRPCGSPRGNAWRSPRG